MAKEHDWKSCIRDERIEGSNPFLSAIKWRVTQEAEGDGLLNR